MRKPLIQINVTCGCDTAAILERLTQMASEQQAQAEALAARLTAETDRIVTSAAGISADVNDLKAQVDALKAQITEPVDFTSIDNAIARVQTQADALAALDAETPAPAPEPTPEPEPAPEPTPAPPVDEEPAPVDEPTA